MLWGLIIAALAALCVAALWQGLTVKAYTEATDKVTSPIRMTVIADLHDTFYGDHQEGLIRAIDIQHPDIIVFVGDIADDRRPNDGTKQLLAVVGKNYPCYFVTGNHENWSADIGQIKNMVRSYGVTILEGDARIVQIDGNKLRICGIDDPGGYGRTYSDRRTDDIWRAQFTACKAAAGDDIYSILLSHRPEKTAEFTDSSFDLIVAGHAHGGQVRIPGILNGVLAPNQGLFPKYAGGRYVLGKTRMIVSRGLSKNGIPRVFNPPELVIVDIIPNMKHRMK